jgi:hypothetical protein
MASDERHEREATEAYIQRRIPGNIRRIPLTTTRKVKRASCRNRTRCQKSCNTLTTVGNVSIGGDINILGDLTTPNRIKFSAYRTSTTTFSNATLIYNATSFNVGNAYNSTTGIFTAPIAGTYYFTCSYYCLPNNFNEVQFRLNGSNLVEVMRIGVTNFNNSKNNGALLIDLQANDEISLICTQATMQLIGAPIPINIFAGYLLG